MSQNYAHHRQGAPKTISQKVLITAIIIILGFSIMEALGGRWSGSLTLLSDSGHMAFDAIALVIAAVATWISRKPPSKKHSYGLGRAEIIAAWFSSLLIIIIAITVIIQAINRIYYPESVKGAAVIWIAFIGMCINIFLAWLLTRGKSTLNMRAVFLHLMGDILGSIAALISGTVIYFTHWFPIDLILSTFIGMLIIIASLRLLKDSLRVLMEGVPGHIRFSAVKAFMEKNPTVKAIHDLHIWTLSSGKVALSAHVDIHEMSTWTETLKLLSQTLEKEFLITHITLQPEPDVIDCKSCC